MTDEIIKAADELVAAFSEGRLDDYFNAFAPDATFVFHTFPTRIESTDSYRDIWSTWVAEDGFKVLGCSSSDRRVQAWGDAAVFTHSVETHTHIATNAGSETLYERETIVFQRGEDGRWIAVHEHLSPVPPKPVGIA